jgi:hypothetical protein
MVSREQRTSLIRTLRIYLESRKFGDVITYEEIQNITKLKSRAANRRLLKAAEEATNVSLINLHNVGYKVPEKDIAIEIPRYSIKRISNTIKRGEKATKKVNVVYGKQLNNDERKELSNIMSFYGAIRLLSGKTEEIMASKFNPKSDNQPTTLPSVANIKFK